MFGRHKYNARKTKCESGHYHPSMLEARHCDRLKILKESGEIKDYICQKTFELRVNGQLIGRHKPDFLIINYDGSQEIHETKGMETNDFLMRKKLFEAIYPEIKYRVVKQ